MSLCFSSPLAPKGVGAPPLNPVSNNVIFFFDQIIAFNHHKNTLRQAFGINLKGAH